MLKAGADATYGLEIAVQNGNLGVVQLCLEYGADPAIADVDDTRYSGSDLLATITEIRELLEKWK